ncbi:MAG: neutral/alkaline non-lysosomal ceramidase N-terminal domain-containing protein [Chloroflexia bacterium]|nr:neutral/alkaline non-lysosomal ceramidase N-terminal domain-containing protein [Chloroflexia bacterium]
MSRQTLAAGVGRVEITPPLTAPHAGWGAQLHELPDGVDQELLATVLVVSDGLETVAFCELELVILSRAESDAIRSAVAAELSIEPAQVRVCVSHNHAGPPPSAWNWTARGEAALAGYYALLPAQVAGAAREAKLALRPARIGWGRGESRVAVNRRETAPDGRTVTGVNQRGPTDPEVLVVRLDGIDGEPIAAIVGYTMHPTFLGPTNRLISPDWPGHMRAVFEQVTGAPCLFAQGATGDVGPGPKGFSDDLRAVHGLGAQVGCEAARVWLNLDLPARTYRHQRVWESGAPLGKWSSEPVAEGMPSVRGRAVSADLPLKTQIPVETARTDVDAAQARLDRLRDTGAPANEIEAATFATKRANMTLFRSTTYSGMSAAPVEIHLLQVGPIVFAGVEGEPFSELGKRVKRESPFDATWFGGYTGGWAGYVATAAEFPRGGYEVETSPFAETAADVLVAATLSALHDLANEEGRGR